MGKILRILDYAITGVGVLSLLLLIIIAFIQVLFRYIFHNALPWPEEVCRFVFIILAYAGMAMTMRSNGHLRVDVAISFASRPVAKFLNVLTLICTCIYCMIGGWRTYEMLIAIRDMEQMASTVNVAIYVTWIPIPVFLVLTAVYALLQIYACLAGTDISKMEGN